MRVWKSSWWTRIRQLSVILYNELFRTRAFTMAAAMSYYFLLALLPLLIFFSALLGYLPIPNLFDQLLDILAIIVPPQAMHMVERLLAGLLAPRRVGLISFGFLGYLWTASGGFSALIDALNVAYDVENTRPWWRDRLQALLLTVTTGLFVLVALLMIITGPHFGHLLTELFPVPRIFADMWPAFRIVTIFVLFVVAIELQYYLGPNHKQRFMSTFPGALVAVGGIFLSSAGMTYYFAHFANYNKMYGAMGAVIVLMVWFYVIALLFVSGAELNAEMLKLKGKEEPARMPARAPVKAKGMPAA